MFKKILVPIDGSRTAALGLDTAIKLAREQGAALYILNVVDYQAVIQGIELGGIGTDHLFESMRAGGKRVLAGAEARAKKHGLAPKVALVDSSVRGVADAVIRHAKKWGADLIVVGTHGRRGISRLVMGSNAEEIVRAAPTPILLVRSRTRSKAARR